LARSERIIPLALNNFNLRRQQHLRQNDFLTLQMRNIKRALLALGLQLILQLPNLFL
jgi:hypothetical protein